jgi:HEAT repeat protein
MQVMGKLRDARTVTPLVKCLQDIRTQYHAERALVEMGPMAEKDLLPLLSQKKPDVRAVAVRIFKAIGTPESIPALEAASQEFTLQVNAKDAIKTIQARSQK